MKFLLLLASLLVGAGVAYVSILGALWYLMPVFVIVAIVVATALDKASRWRIAAFCVGAVAVLGWYGRSLLQEVSARELQVQSQLRQEQARQKAN